MTNRKGARSTSTDAPRHYLMVAKVVAKPKRGPHAPADKGGFRYSDAEQERFATSDKPARKYKGARFDQLREAGRVEAAQPPAQATVAAAGRHEPERSAAIDEAVTALATAFNNVAKIKQLHGVEQDDFLMRFVAMMLEKLRNGTLPAGAGELPAKAPEIWAGRDRSVKTNPAQFIRRVYGLWLGRGLKRGHLRELDPQLYQAFANWVFRHPEDDIPELARKYEEVDGILAELSLLYDPDQLRRLGMALHSRLKRGSGNSI